MHLHDNSPPFEPKHLSLASKASQVKLHRLLQPETKKCRRTEKVMKNYFTCHFADLLHFMVACHFELIAAVAD
jgi:hypothetical protein